jgi:hypothetical protein
MAYEEVGAIPFHRLSVKYKEKLRVHILIAFMDGTSTYL